jgi:hypothetical protein
MAAFNDKEPGAGIALAKDQLALAIVPHDCMLSQKLEFCLRKIGKDWDPAKSIYSARFGRHLPSIVNPSSCSKQQPLIEQLRSEPGS